MLSQISIDTLNSGNGHIHLAKVSSPSVEEVRIASLKVLAMTLLSQVESLERELAANEVSELNLQKEVHSFEAAIIRSALAKTGGRQRKAARLLGVKVTTLNTKIKRHKLGPQASSPADVA
ncbi:MAG TPA: helix-turn-helix domain-containing protein [Pyrinomonadaceae bacterium]